MWLDGWAMQRWTGGCFLWSKMASRHCYMQLKRSVYVKTGLTFDAKR
jgi:hypothetical protein